MSDRLDRDKWINEFASQIVWSIKKAEYLNGSDTINSFFVNGDKLKSR